MPYKNYKDQKILQDLIVKYCSDSRFQVRVCEKAFLMTTLVPFLQIDNPYELIRTGTMCLSFLSENSETHKKLIKAGVVENIGLLIVRQLHNEILNYSLRLIFNLSNQNVDKALEKII